MEDGNQRFYGFGEFRVDARRRILNKNGEAITLSPRNFDLLLVLIENEGQILTHDDLLDKVWQGTFVEQANLKNAISVLRRVLGEEPNEALYIRTVPRRGYCFVAPVRVIADETHEDHVSQSSEPQMILQEVPEEIVVYNVRDHSSALNHGVAPQSPSSQAHINKFLIGAVLVAVAVAIVFALRPYLTSDDSIKYDATKVKITKITSDGNLVGGNASISPNGKYLVYAVRGGEGVSLWTRQLVTGISRQISPSMQGSVWACSLTVDEEFIYYVFNSNTDAAKSGLFKISTFGGSAQKINDNNGGSLSMSPDGKRLATRRVTPELLTIIETMKLDGSDIKTVWSMPGDIRIWDLKYAADGATIMYSVRKTLTDKMVYYIGEVPVDGGTERVIIPDQEKQIADSVWLPDKESLLVSVRELNAELRQIWQYFIQTKEWKRVTNDNASYRGISLTTDGKTLVASQESRVTLLWASPTGSADDISQVMPGTHYLIDISWTNDKRIVYSMIENSAEKIGLMNADGSGNRLITNGDDGIWLFPAASRDGKHIAFASARTGKRQIWTIDADGRNPTQLSQFETDTYDGRLFADGVTAIFLNDATPQRSELVLRKPDGTTRVLSGVRSKRWALSPDERLIAVELTNAQTQMPEIAIINVETGETVRRLDANANRVLRFTPDGKSIAYDHFEGETTRITLVPIDGTAAKPFLTLRSEDPFSFDWSPDGKRFALIRGKHLTDAVKITVGD